MSITIIGLIVMLFLSSGRADKYAYKEELLAKSIHAKKGLEKS